MNKVLIKKRKEIFGEIPYDKAYSLSEAIFLIKRYATAKFNESIDAAINLGVDSCKSDQVIRGVTVLPHGSGRAVKVAVFAQGDDVEKAKSAGADFVGLEDLAKYIQEGKDTDFDVVIATPETMRVVGKLGQILGPRGLMPNPKLGTVTTDLVLAIRNAKQGEARYRTDKNGIIHCAIGKANFKEKALEENLQSILADIKKIKPNTIRGTYLKKLTLSSTMGPSFVIDRATLGNMNLV